ncbi:hypothetical protein JOD03_000973 [Chryseomicrobium aureum]|uniref:hypothetical protein n=1 Tax=Chryseomicrobium aureum TaxID=1441723 RepID=UPI001EF77D44|nr:hypothetical protein [Chryseomicrobium aureum]MBM7706071.1 hypothetical protein [Chryseomicrobium aureum]
MQRYILSKKNSITLISAILIALAFFGRFSLDNMAIFNWSLIIASILGVAPIAIQAYQALKVKVVSIDVLVENRYLCTKQFNTICINGGGTLLLLGSSFICIEL